MADKYVLKNYGGMNTQFDNVFSNGGSNPRGNEIMRISGGGRRSRKTRSKSYLKKRRGGNLPLGIGESLTPLAIYGAQHYYKNRYGKNKFFPKSVKRFGRRFSRRNFSFKKR